MKEVEAKCYAGPFKEIPFKNFIQSPIGLVPKDNGKNVRLIFHLSHPRGTNKSVNANTPKEKYPDFNRAIQLCMRAGKGCKLSKSDMKSAFRNLGLRISDWKYLIMQVESPFDKKIFFFVDKCLPFGASISCSHFQTFSNAISHIVQTWSNIYNFNIQYNLLFIALLTAMCNGQMEVFLDICQQIRFPISEEKTFWSSTQMTFLGFLIDTVRQLVIIPTEKLNKGQVMLERILNQKSKKITMKELQRICGFLNFLGRCIVPGRAFTRRLYSFLNQNLKPYHHIRINQEMRRDLLMWQTFLMDQSCYARGFMDFSEYLQADTISMFSDASRSEILGMGAVCQDSWCVMQWPKDYIAQFSPSIEYLELYALIAGVINWIHRFKTGG